MFSIKEMIDREGFIKIVDELERTFHLVQKGFIDTELVFIEKTNQWILFQHWTSKKMN